MRSFLFFLLWFGYITSKAQSPLSSFSAEWKDPGLLNANTAKNISYLSVEEKNIVYILNLVRLRPKLFAETVLKIYPAYSGNENLAQSSFFKSLYYTLSSINPMALVFSNENNYISALCHAKTSGQHKYIGHERQTNECKKKQSYAGECCSYGHSSAIDIVISLLIDEGVPSLGHRNILLGDYTKCGVSIQPHKSDYKFCAVLDFDN